MDDRISIMLLT